jgi:hypothetical protein
MIQPGLSFSNLNHGLSNRPHFPLEADIGIFGSHVLITSVKKEYFTIDIESKEIARAFRTIFEMVWISAKE